MPEWEVGDVVRVVDAPYRDCPFAWVRDMDRFCSRKAKIINKYFSPDKDTFYYKISTDNQCYNWCKDCFEPIEEEEADFEISDDEFDNLIFT